MTVEVMPVGVKCSMMCEMCFQAPMRLAGNACPPAYSVEAMKRGLTAENYHFTLFGGEPLLTPIADLEELWRWGLEKFGQNGIQTSASGITEKHYELFEKYKVSVGISLDGPGKLNDIRWAGTINKTRETTDKSIKALHRLLDSGHIPSLITMLSKENASPGRLALLLDWFLDLDERGLRHVNLHLMEIDDTQVRIEFALSPEENADALIACADLRKGLKQLTFQPIAGMTDLLLGNDEKSSCMWNGCDPYTTRAVRGVGADGGRVNCSRSNKAGVDMQKADKELLVRPIALYHTDRADGGCGGCRFWIVCKGGCPGEAPDWRRKTEHCEALDIVWAELEGRLASLGLDPVTCDHDRRRAVEVVLLGAHAAGKPARINEILRMGKHDATLSGYAHGDSPHGDSGHGDHTDVANPVITHGDSR